MSTNLNMGVRKDSQTPRRPNTYELTVAWRRAYSGDVEVVKVRSVDGFTWERVGNSNTYEFISEDGNWNGMYTNVVYFTEVIVPREPEIRDHAVRLEDDNENENENECGNGQDKTGEDVAA